MGDVGGHTNYEAETNGVAPHPMQERLNVGVVGIGRMGQRHAVNLLRFVPRARLVCACSPDETDLKWADEHLAPFGVSVFRTFEEMVDFPGLQAVVIASATALHYQHTLESLRRGIHVLCEKPIAASVHEVRGSPG
jgi:myo-inositol 2-dehydrogenase / D-chiro-inositol 1-dehydrogenase